MDWTGKAIFFLGCSFRGIISKHVMISCTKLGTDVDVLVGCNFIDSTLKLDIAFWT